MVDGVRNRILVGDAATRLRELPDECVDCCVTSPPYWGLRDYGTGRWEGGDPACDHVERDARRDVLPEYLERRAKEWNTGTGNGSRVARIQFSSACGKCRARRVDRQIGLEKTPDEYAAKLVEVFRGVRRALKKTGTLWLNLGDSYSSTAGNYRGKAETVKIRSPKRVFSTSRPWSKTSRGVGLPPKNLIGIPWRVAFALQADGWYLRSDIIWQKPDPMPESVTDRPTKSHEYIFLLAKNERYYYDAEAVAERSVTNDPRRPYGSKGAWEMDGRPDEPKHGIENRFNVKRGGFDGKTNDLPGRESFRKFTETRNRRDVWTIATQPFSEAHFAAFPEALIEPCILAGCPVGGVVLDPFLGSGTTALVAARNGRDWVGIELSAEYAEMARRRIAPEAQQAKFAGILR